MSKYQRTAEFLLKLGNDAAQSFCTESIPLTDAVHTLRDNLKLSDEETRRVAENANRSAYLKMFHAAPADNKIVNFPLADAEAIIGSTTEKKASFVEFYQPKTDNFKYSKLVNAAAEYERFEKSASAPQPRTEVRNIQREWLMTKRAAEIIRGEHTVAERRMHEAKADFQKVALDLFTQGYNLGDLLHALVPFTKEANADLLLALKPCLSQTNKAAAIRTTLTVKEASVPNENHPLIHSFKNMIKAAESFKAAEGNLYTAQESEKRLREEVLRETK